MTILIWGLGSPVAAQTPGLSAPGGLPPLPGLPTLSSGASSPTPPSSPQATTPVPPASPAAPVGLSDLSALPPLPSPTTAPTQTAASTSKPPVLSDLPPLNAETPQLPTVDQSATAQNAPAANEVPPVLVMPSIAPSAETVATVPALPSAETSADSLPGGLTIPPPLPKTRAETAKLGDLPTVSDVTAPPQAKSWMTSLAPSYTPPKTNFRYKRELLPGTIYRKQYDRENQHLPQAVTREDYRALLSQSIAKNDVEATRALLNAGTSVNEASGTGETPLMLASRYGASDVARLLIARGAQ